MFRDHPVNGPYQTGYEMMCHSGIRVKHCPCLVRRPIEGLMHLGKDWTLMLQSCLILLAQIVAQRLDSKASISGS